MAKKKAKKKAVSSDKTRQQLAKKTEKKAVADDRRKKRNEKEVAKAVKKETGEKPKQTVKWEDGEYYIGKTSRTKPLYGEPKEEIFRVVRVKKDGVMVESAMTKTVIQLPLFYKARIAKSKDDRALIKQAIAAAELYRQATAKKDAEGKSKPKSKTYGYTAFVREAFINGPTTNDKVLKATLKRFPECTEEQVKKVLGPQKWHAQQAGYRILKAKIGKAWYYTAAKEGEIKIKQKELADLKKKLEKVAS